VDLSATLEAHLRQLSGSMGADEDETVAGVGELSRELRLAIPSFLGLQLVLVEHGHPMTLTDFEPTARPRDIRSSVRFPLVPLGVDGMDPAREIFFYAGVSGAFVDLATDVGYVLGLPVRGPAEDATAADRPVVVLDDPIAPTTVASGLVGAVDLSTLNRAIGVLMGEGQPSSEAAQAELLRLAAVAGVSVLALASKLIDPVDP